MCVCVCECEWEEGGYYDMSDVVFYMVKNYPTIFGYMFVEEGEQNDTSLEELHSYIVHSY